MGLMDLLRRLMGLDGQPETAPRSVREKAAAQASVGHAVEGDWRNLEGLCSKLDLPIEQLRSVRIAYRKFQVPKASGGTRTISAPEDDLKIVQRRILRCVLANLPVHQAAMGFEPGKSIVTNANPHQSRAVVVRMDLKDFFGSTGQDKVREYFSAVGCDRETATILTKLCTSGGALPQGAPTSPKLSNLVNWRLDARLAGLAGKLGAAYTRYADDLTFSFAADDRDVIHALIRSVKFIVRDEQYELHQDRKLQIRRRYDRQTVTGLVVNHRTNLSRKVRRWLRAVEHRQANGGQATITPAQLEGWRALAGMVAAQAATKSP